MRPTTQLQSVRLICLQQHFLDGCADAKILLSLDQGQSHFFPKRKTLLSIFFVIYFSVCANLSIRMKARFKFHYT